MINLIIKSVTDTHRAANGMRFASLRPELLKKLPVIVPVAKKSAQKKAKILARYGVECEIAEQKAEIRRQITDSRKDKAQTSLW